MKITYFLRLMLICSMLFLVACGGGGGGGGGVANGGNDNPQNPPNPPKVVTLAELAGGATELGKAAALSDVLGEGLVQTGLSTPEKINGSWHLLRLGVSTHLDTEISIDSDRMIMRTPEGTLTFSANDFTLFNNGLAGIILGEKSIPITEELTGEAGSSGLTRVTEAMILGGNSVDLQYASFGVWEARVTAQGSIGNEKIDTAYSFYHPFTLEGATAQKIVPPNSGIFTGAVIANAYEYPNANLDYLHHKTVSLAGQATLNLTSATSGNIVFDFANFPTVSVNSLAIDEYDGSIRYGNDFRVSNQNKNTTGINLLDMGYGNVSGQFYGGPGDVSASEAVGSFHYSSGKTGIMGAFGVRK